MAWVNEISRSGLESDIRLLEAIEAVSGGSLDCKGGCGEYGTKATIHPF